MVFDAAGWHEEGAGFVDALESCSRHVLAVVTKRLGGLVGVEELLQTSILPIVQLSVIVSNKFVDYFKVVGVDVALF